MQGSSEPIRRDHARTRGAAPPRNTNSIANLMQILRRSVGQTWGGVKREIMRHPKHADRRTRGIVRDRLETLVCLPGRTLQSFHTFLVSDAGILERVENLAS